MTRRQKLRNIPALMAVLVLGLGFGGVAFAQHGTATRTINVTLYDGRLKATPTSFSPGRVTLVVVNRGKLTHALAIMGAKVNAKRTKTLKTGQSARLTVTLTSSMYHVWDPVRGTMSKATMLMPQTAPAAGSTTSGSGSGDIITQPPMGGGTSGGTGTATTPAGSSTMPGMDPNDPCAGMM